MNAHAKQEVIMREEASVPASESAAIIQVIERAAMNPAVDIDKMERLLQMQERIMERNARSAYAAALARMQPELPVIAERGKGDKNMRYALWEDVVEQIKPVLARHGFAISFRTGRDGDRITVTGVLSHAEGHSEETTMHLPVDTSGSKNAVQAVGSSTSYGKRYTASALLNLTSRYSEDDDGKAAGGVIVISDEQAATIRERLDAVGADVKRFCDYIKVESIAGIPARDYEAALKVVAAKEKQARGGGQ